jgi:hypothetical protein
MNHPIPSPAWSIVSLIGLAGWISSVIFLIQNGFRADGTMRERSVRFWVVVLAGFYVIWLVGLRML